MANIINYGDNLIPISENNGKRAVSARDLHKFLESKRDFSNWIKDRIEKYGLIENQDYEVFNNFDRKFRYNIRLAMRHGVECVVRDKSYIDELRQSYKNS